MINKILHILLSSCLLVLINNATQAQDVLQVHSGANFYNTGNIGVYGDVVHEGDLRCGGINFYGQTWTNSPTATIVLLAASGAILFTQPNPLYGSFAVQNIDGGGSTSTFRRIGINNPNNVQLINTDSYIFSRLDFLGDGHLVLNNQDLSLASAALIQGASVTAHIKTNAAITASKGFLIRESVGATNTVYPIGNTAYNPATINNSGVADDIKIRVNDEVLGNGTSGLAYFTDRVARTWHVEEAIAGGSNVAMTLQWEETEELSGFDRTDCGVKHYTGGVWDNPAYSPATNVAGTTWSQTRTGIVSFSPFGVRDPDEGSLPIELVYFGVKLQEDCNGSLITWTTATEKNVARFELEYSLDGIQFATIGQELPTNTVNTHSYYHSFYDLNLSGNAANYFRLKSIDEDGSFAYSDVVHLNATPCLSGSKNKYDYSIYPSPNNIGELYIRLPQGFEENKEGVFIVTDVLGRTVLEQIQNLNKGQRIFRLDIQNLAAGTYFIQHKNKHVANLSPHKFVVIHP